MDEYREVRHYGGMKLALKKIRLAKGLTVAEVMERTGLSKGFVSQLENGRRQAGPETLESLAAALGVPVAMLIDPGEDGGKFSRAMAALCALPDDDYEAVMQLAAALAARRAR